jgi:hypothetical protein
MLLNRVAQIEETTLSFPQFALFHSVTCVQLRLITILGNRGCVAIASFLGVRPIRTLWLAWLVGAVGASQLLAVNGEHLLPLVTLLLSEQVL